MDTSNLKTYIPKIELGLGHLACRAWRESRTEKLCPIS